MATLRETKDRIGSVRSTLKITSAMKLVASAKLRKAQKAIEGMRPYERTLAEILSAIRAGESPQRADRNYFSVPEKPISAQPSTTPTHASPAGVPTSPRSSSSEATSASAHQGITAVVAIASNSSLCGAFNANVVRKALETIRACEGEVEVIPVGRKMAEALRRAGYTNPADFNDIIGHPSYEKSAALARSLAERFQAGELSRVVLVYNRFISSARQEPAAEVYLPFGMAESSSWADSPSTTPAHASAEAPVKEDYIIEPDAETLLATLLPQVMMLKFHAAVLDSAAAEHAARTVAMQTASDNAEELLGELTLEYNKGRQQKITAEILDLLGGAAQ